MNFSDNPIRDFHIHDKQQYDKLQKLPICIECKERIQDEIAYEFKRGLVCESCIEGHKIFLDLEEWEVIYEK